LQRGIAAKLVSHDSPRVVRTNFDINSRSLSPSAAIMKTHSCLAVAAGGSDELTDLNIDIDLPPPMEEIHTRTLSNGSSNHQVQFLILNEL